MNSRSIASPPYSPGGRLIEWSTHEVDRVAAGRGPKFGDAQRARARRSQPSRHADVRAVRAHSRSAPPRVAADVDAEARHAVAHLAQRQAQARAGRGAVEAMALERAHQDVALDVVEVLAPGRSASGSSTGAIARRRRARPRIARSAAARDLVELLRRAVGEDRLGQAEVVDVDLLGARQRHRAVQQVLELAHVARERIARQVDQRVARQPRRAAQTPASRAMRSSTRSLIADRSSSRSRSGGTRIWITLSR